MKLRNLKLRKSGKFFIWKVQSSNLSRDIGYLT